MILMKPKSYPTLGTQPVQKQTESLWLWMKYERTNHSLLISFHSINLLEPSNSKVSEFLIMFVSLGFLVCIWNPTKITHHSAILIDETGSQKERFSIYSWTCPDMCRRRATFNPIIPPRRGSYLGTEKEGPSWHCQIYIMQWCPKK